MELTPISPSETSRETGAPNKPPVLTMLTRFDEALIDACTNAMRLAREEHNPAHQLKQLQAAADLLNSEAASRLPYEEFQNLANLYAEAHLLVTGGLVG